MLTSTPTIDLVAGARPNFVKLAPVVAALRAHPALRFRVVHTGQHYDAAMSDVFFAELGLPAPDVHLEVGSGSHAVQTARILERYERHLLEALPAATVVFGDVNSTIACALAAAKIGVPVVHVEAGLRSFDRTMPEEINRILTDAVADLLLVSEPAGLANLKREGVPDSKVRHVGNVMIDSLLTHLPAARRRLTARSLGVTAEAYGFVTLHRPSNVDDPAVLGRLLALFARMSADLPLVFAVHPRTSAAIEAYELGGGMRPGGRGLHCVPPQPYLDALSLAAGARLIVTDSGGLQEEASVLGIPCLTLRTTTERPVTVTQGTSRLLGNDIDRIEEAFRDALAGRWPAAQTIPLWDGHAGERVAQELLAWVGRGV